MSLCDELYNEARQRLVKEGMPLTWNASREALDRHVLRLLCERVEKLIEHSHEDK
jgi:hypothetical protein